MKVTYRQLGPGMMQQLQSVCSNCGGDGEIFNEADKCKTCNGKRVVVETKILEVHVDKGMRDGEKITFRGEGDQQPNVEPGKCCYAAKRQNICVCDAFVLTFSFLRLR